MTDARELINRARAAWELGRPDEGLKLATRAAAIAPADSWVLGNLSWMQQLTGRWDASVETADRVIASDPEYEWGYRLRGRGLVKLGRMEDAVDAFAEARRCDPSSFRAHVVFAQYAGQVGRAQDAVAAARTAVELAADDSTAWFALGYSHYLLKQFDEAEVALVKARELGPDDSNNNNNLGLVYLYTGRFAEALACFQRALALDSRSEYAFLNAAIVLRRLDRWEEADDLRRRFRLRQLHDARELVEASPTSAYAWLRRGIAHHNLGDLEAGLADFRRALEEAKDTSERAQPLGRIAWASLRLGDDETAKAETELLLRDHGDDPWVLAGCSGMGWLLGEQEFTVRAERLAISAGVNPITIAAIRGDRAIAEGNWAGAIDALEESALTIAGRHCCLLATLGVARWHAGDHAGAALAVSDSAHFQPDCDTLVAACERGFIPLEQLVPQAAQPFMFKSKSVP